MDNSAVSTPELAGFRSDVRQLKVDLDDLRHDVSRLAGDVVHTARAGASEARERLDRGARVARLRSRQAIRAVEDETAHHPLLAIGAAFLVGAAAGTLLARVRR